MVIDTSAVIAILEREDDAAGLIASLAGHRIRVMSAVSLLEASIVVESRAGAEGLARLDALVATAAIEIVQFDARQVAVAREAYATYGKGRHQARLNMGDCASYALARIRNEPLLFKGNDFIHTDIPPASPASRT